MRLKPLPPGVQELLVNLKAPARLVAHLSLVHDVACLLVAGVDAAWPELTYDRAAVLIGAATHDIGKAVYVDELSGPGNKHEDCGYRILVEAGFPQNHARFARTHGAGPVPLEQIQGQAIIEDLLVRLADTIWKGARREGLERELCNKLAELSREEPWCSYLKLDDLVCRITESADERLAWQAAHSCGT